MNRGVASLVLGATIMLGLVGCSESAKPVQEVAKFETFKKSEAELREDYLSLVKEENTKSAQAMRNVSKLFERATMHPELFHNPRFQSDLEKEYKVVEDTYFKLKMYKELDIPSDLLKGHRDLLTGYEYCYNGNNLTWDGVLESNSQKIKDGADLIRQGVPYITLSGLDN
ncbi:putative signal peptide-containing lipoprotein [Bacillus phage Izhevsk]|uniref:Putative signal peptide-containing lipoprotein n=1 Tax=Bacillus phage Izhevsk TaxID=2724322 RepID=A0A6H0X612_9CAUD|nr:putative signal peptide-containing lipoprotein [Bacillus phage Izhevsk]QIW89760.1 putative signal peptide-containing lipoprotein [Bacillus phage Izhevsk]